VKSVWRAFPALFIVVLICLLLCACGDTPPWRFDPGPPEQPVGLVATAGNGQIELSWNAVSNPYATYNIYYLTAPGVSKSSGIKIQLSSSTSYIKTGLSNDTTYYIVVTSVNLNGVSYESAESNQVTATPAVPGPYAQGDLAGAWNFNALVTGPGAGWKRGALVVDNAGTVSFSSYQDSTGNTQPPAALFPALLLNPSGHVRDSNAGVANFQGVMAASRKMIVGDSSPDGVSRMMTILQRQVTGVTFSNAGDIQGFGNTGGGSRRFIYNQIASGTRQEWEFAVGQIGKDQKIQYSTFSAPSNPVKPGDKASILNISTDGIVTETLTAALPQPAVVIDRGVMSADKSVIIGTATDTSGTSPRYLLRIYQMVNIISSDPNSFTLADLAGSYDLRKILSGASSLSAVGAMTIDASGSASISSYIDSIGTAVLPADFTLAMDTSGGLNSAADPTLLGKFSYFKDMFVVTRTESPSAYSLSIALKR
jgi:hypothetical protein